MAAMALVFGDFELFPATYELRRSGEPIHLEPRVFEVLAYLIAHRDRVVAKQELIERVWEGQAVSDSALTRVVRDARRALGDTGAKERWIETVHGRGFRFSGSVDEREPASGAPATATVAVLPFLDLGVEASNEVIADGVTEDVIVQLAKIGGLRIVASASARPFKSRDQTPQEIGRQLGATAILRGSVRSSGTRLRIVAELVDAASASQLWAETYDREIDDLFAIQTDVALQIAGALRRELSADERRRLDWRPTRDLRAYQLYLQGRYSFGRYTAESIRNGLRYYQEAVAVDPGFALAHAGLARGYAELANEGVDPRGPRESFALASQAVAKALELDQTLGEAHCIVGLLAFYCDFDWAAAERSFRRALELSPGCADAYDYYGWMCSALERYDEAVELLRRAKELDPVAHPTDLAGALLRSGRHREAIEEAERAIEFDPALARGHSTKGWALIQTGRSTEGVAAVKRAAELTQGGTLFLAQLGQAYAVTGDLAAAGDVLQRLEELGRRRYVSPYHMAYVFTGLGKTAEAIACLEQAYEQRCPAIAGVKGSFLFVGLRGHPGFVALLRKMNLA
jgi:TolB-like protein/Flp pilus assembly protein TadD